MSVTSIIATVEAEAKIWEVKAATFLEGVAISAVQKAVALVKETSVGTAIFNMVSAMSNTTLSGADKMGAVLAGAQSLYDAFVTAGGLKGLLAEGVSILRQLAQLVYDEFAQASASAAAALKTASTAVGAVASTAAVAVA